MALSESDILDLKFDADGSLFTGPNGFEFVRGVEGVAWLCRVAILLYLGEWFLNQAKGVPWKQEILGVKGVDLSLVRRRLSDVLVAVTGVASVDSLVVTPPDVDRRMTVQASVSTVFGVQLTVTIKLGGTPSG